MNRMPHMDNERNNVHKMMNEMQMDESKAKGLMYSLYLLIVTGILYYNFPESPLIVAIFLVILTVFLAFTIIMLNKFFNWNLRFVGLSLLVIGTVSFILLMLNVIKILL
jgi:heme O synthase-like polyprenyltransferase